jgi:hypothetical protein
MVDVMIDIVRAHPIFTSPDSDTANDKTTTRLLIFIHFVVQRHSIELDDGRFAFTQQSLTWAWP